MFASPSARHSTTPGTTAVPSGGSAATYYAPRAHQSRDADFIIVMSLDGEVATSALDGLGYEQIGGTYAHRENRYTLEFPPGPLAVGGDRIIAYETVRRNSEILRIISATDCVRDRLASFSSMTIAAPCLPQWRWLKRTRWTFKPWKTGALAKAR